MISRILRRQFLGPPTRRDLSLLLRGSDDVFPFFRNPNEPIRLSFRLVECYSLVDGADGTVQRVFRISPRRALIGPGDFSALSHHELMIKSLLKPSTNNSKHTVSHPLLISESEGRAMASNPIQ
jgi:hypothetical protein